MSGLNLGGRERVISFDPTLLIRHAMRLVREPFMRRVDDLFIPKYTKIATRRRAPLATLTRPQNSLYCLARKRR
jgi:hypothetical protein